MGQQKKIRVYELDFGDTNLLSPDSKEILSHIQTEMEDMRDSDELEYKITIRRMSQKEMDELPEWS